MFILPSPIVTTSTQLTPPPVTPSSGLTIANLPVVMPRFILSSDTSRTGEVSNLAEIQFNPSTASTAPPTALPSVTQVTRVTQANNEGNTQGTTQSTPAAIKTSWWAVDFYGAPRWLAALVGGFLCCIWCILLCVAIVKKTA